MVKRGWQKPSVGSHSVFTGAHREDVRIGWGEPHTGGKHRQNPWVPWLVKARMRVRSGDGSHKGRM